MGYIYVLSNPSMPGLRKIGKTTTSPNQRMAELHSTGVPTPFVLEYSFEVSDCDTCERDAHRALASYRVASNREFFRVSAVAVLRELLPVVEQHALPEPDEQDASWVDELWAQKDEIQAQQNARREAQERGDYDNPMFDEREWGIIIQKDSYKDACVYCEKPLRFGAPFFEGFSYDICPDVGCIGECVCDDCHPRHIEEVNTYRAKLGWKPISW